MSWTPYTLNKKFSTILFLVYHIWQIDFFCKHCVIYVHHLWINIVADEVKMMSHARWDFIVKSLVVKVSVLEMFVLISVHKF